MINRRLVLLGLAAPAVVPITSLMPARTPRVVRAGIVFPTCDELVSQMTAEAVKHFGEIACDSWEWVYIQVNADNLMKGYDELKKVYLTQGRGL